MTNKIQTVSPIDGTFIRATAIDSVMQGMTDYQWKVLKRAVRDRFDQPEHLLSLAAGRNAIREVIEETLKKPSLISFDECSDDFDLYNQDISGQS